MMKTETTGVVTADEGLTVTVPSDPALTTTHAVVMHSPVVSAASEPMAAPVALVSHAHQAMTEVPGWTGLPVTSTDPL